MASPPAATHSEHSTRDDMNTIKGSRQGHERSSEPREGLPRRPIASAIALALLFVALPIGYLFGYLC